MILRPKMNVRHHTHSFWAITVLLNFNIHAECLQTNLPFVIHSNPNMHRWETQQRRRLSRFSTYAITNCESEYDYESSKLNQHKKNPSSSPDIDDDDDDDDDDPLVVTDLTPGKPHGYFIVQKYNVPAPPHGFPNLKTCGLFQEADIQRLGLTPTNVTLPSALVMLDPDRYPDIQSSLRASRDGSILIQRYDFDVDGGGSTGSSSSEIIVDVSKCKRGRVGDRIFPNDTLYRQKRMVDAGASEHWCRSYDRSKNDTSLLGNVNVVYEDDHMAIVNKPGGVEIFQHSLTIMQDGDGASSSSGKNTMKELLPFALRPPTRGVVADVLAIPEAAHRLDKPTSGLLLVAKTRPSLKHLSAQFRGLRIEKTYTAICHGTPKAIINGRREGVMGPIKIHPSEDDDNKAPLGGENRWQSTEAPLDGKSAITHWRVLKHLQHNNTTQLSLLELKPKTGRYRQLRRHMAKIHGCPLVGDTVFAKGIEKGGNNGKLGLFLCSSAVRFEHPCYGASSDVFERNRNAAARLSSDGSSVRVTFRSEGDRLMVEASIDLHQKFADLLEI